MSKWPIKSLVFCKTLFAYHKRKLVNKIDAVDNMNFHNIGGGNNKYRSLCGLLIIVITVEIETYLLSVTIHTTNPRSKKK